MTRSTMALWKVLSDFELRSLMRDRAFWVLLVALAIATAFGAANGVRLMHQQQAVIKKLREDESAQLQYSRTLAESIQKGETPRPRGYWQNPGDMRGFAYYLMTAYAVKPPAALAALATGQGDLLPYQFKVNAGSQDKSLAAYDLQNPRQLRLGRFDLSFVVVFLLPLAILAAVYDALSRERKAGMLSLLAIHGVSPRALTVIRLIWRPVLLVALMVLVALATLSVAGVDLGAPGVAGGLFRWALITLSYSLFWVGLAALLTALTRTSSSAALSLAGAWLLIVVLTPWCLNLTARTLHPLPSRAVYIEAQRDATDDASRDKKNLRSQFLNDHPEMSSADGGSDTVRQYALNQVTALEHIEAQLAPVAARFDTQLLSQQALIDRWQWLSPAVLTIQAMNELSGNSTARHQAFVRQTQAYIASVRQYFNPRMLAGTLAFSDFDGWPRYAWREPDRSGVDSRTRASLLGIATPAVLLAFLGLLVLGRSRSLIRA